MSKCDISRHDAELCNTDFAPLPPNRLLCSADATAVLGSTWCSYHTYMYLSPTGSQIVQWGYVPDLTNYPGCGMTTASPNGNFGIEWSVNTM